MARKTTGNFSTRNKKTGASAPPAALQFVLEAPKDGKRANVAADSLDAVPVNLEEEIRHRAYELYLERIAGAGDISGSGDQDWLIAEREVRSRYGILARHTTA